MRGNCERTVVIAITTLVLASAIATAAVCGGGTASPSPTPAAFVFTPVPFTYIAGPGGTPVAVSLPASATAAKCYPYVADEVIVDVQTDQLSTFKRWLTSVGFSVRSERNLPTTHPATVTVAVPLGSVPQAIPLIEQQVGVVTAGMNSLGKLPEEPNLPVCPTEIVPN